MSPSQPKFLTAVQAAEYLHVSPRVVVDMCNTARLRASKPGKVWLIEEADVIAHIRAASNQAEDVA